MPRTRLLRGRPRTAILCFTVLGAPLAAQLPAPRARLAADGVTIVQPSAAGTVGSPAAGLDGPACADLIYFEENGGSGGVRGLYDFLSATGTSTLRTAVGGSERIFSLAADPSGTVFGVDPLAARLYLVDLTSGTLTFLTSLVGTSTVADITFDPLTGQLYGAERNAPLRLYRIDLATGVATTVGTMTNARTGLTFAPDGTLFGCALNGTLYQIDPATAAETLIGGGGGPTLIEDATVRADGTIFVTDFGGGLYSIDPATGTTTPVGNSGLGSGLLGIVPQPTAVLATEVVRLGSPPNPMALLPGMTSGPLVGATWDPAIDHSSFFPGALIDVLGLSSTAINAPSPFGTVLCNPTVLLAGLAGVPFQLAIPANCSLAGFVICAQGASTDGIAIVVTNALDVVVGTF